MALINIFKKEEENKPAEDKKTAAKTAARAKKAEASKIVTQKTGKKAAHNVAGVLKQPHITEKASRLAEDNQYVFQITPGANKSEVAKAVESYYNVDVIKVNITKVPGKRHRRAKGISQDGDMRKAIVKIKDGQKIELLPR
jgi:large subunit ribosomal protein L23